jgi:nucleotidyltransferase/DNA polymerase involved in DNA repair
MRAIILHVDMDAFYASIEQRDHPEYRGRPVVVGAPADARGVVAACSYEARRFGIHSAMPSREAGRRCPHAVFLPPNMSLYVEVSHQIRAIFERFTPLIEPLSLDEAFLDVTGATTLFGDGPAIARRIRETIHAETQLTASVGVAHNKFLAKLASDMNKPDGLTIVPGDEAGIIAFLAPLPIGRLWGVGKVTQPLLESAGYRTIGDLLKGEPARLASLVGREAAEHFMRLARGEDDRTLELDVEEKSISREYTFDTDCTSRDEVRTVLLDLVDDVGRQLRAAGRYASLARLKLRWKSFETFTRQRPFEHPVCDDFTLRAAAEALFAAEPMNQPVRLVGFGVSRFAEERCRQLDLFADQAGPSDEKKERLTRTVDTLRERHGGGTIRRASSLPRDRGNP